MYLLELKEQLKKSKGEFSNIDLQNSSEKNVENVEIIIVYNLHT